MELKQLKNKEIRELLFKIKELYSIENISKKSIFQTGIIESTKILFVDNQALFFYRNNLLVPTLNLIEKINLNLDYVIVDKGAVKFIVNNAGIMRAGIVRYSEGIKKGSVVLVKEETYNKNIAVGISNYSYDELAELKSGKAIENLHYAGDKLYKLSCR